MHTPDPLDPSENVADVIADQVIPGARQSWLFLPVLVVASFGVYLAMGASIGTGAAALVAQINPEDKYAGLSLIAVLSGIVQTVVTPLTGRLSDRTRSRLGMRKPWLLWGSLIGFAGTVAVGFAPDLVVLIVGVCIAQAGYAVVLMAQHALLAEQVPTQKRGLINGFIGVMGLLTLPVTTYFVALAPHTPWTWFVLPGLLGTVFSVWLVYSFQDRVLDEVLPPLSARDLLGSYWVDPHSAPDFTWAWIGRFLMFLGFAPLATFWLYFLTDRVALGVEEAVSTIAQAGVITTVMTGVAGVAAGWLSDRWGRRKPIVYCCAGFYVAAVVVLLLMPTVAGFYLSFGVLMGVAGGAFGAVVVALQIDVMPSFADAGKDLGIVTLSGSLPMIIGPLLATALLSIGEVPNYDAAIIFAIVVLTVAGLCFVPIRKVR